MRFLGMKSCCYCSYCSSESKVVLFFC